MKPKVEITLVHEEGMLDDVVLGFTTLEQIDSFIQKFEEMRADLEHQIEMEKQRKRDKKKRAKMRRKLDEFNVREFLGSIDNEMKEFDKLSEEEKFNKIIKDYDNLDPKVKDFVKPFIDIAKSLHDLHKK